MPNSPFEEMAALDRLIHDPSRLAILATLEACQAADFVFLQNATGLTKGNLSSHLAKLEEAGLIDSEKSYVDRKPNTSFRLTSEGSVAVSDYWEKLDSLRKSAKRWRIRRG